MSRIIGLDPIVHKQDQILILGSMPSVISLQKQMYYANQNNRFWKVLSQIYDMEVKTEDDKLRLLSTCHIALWDSCASCVRIQSKDASIQDVIVNPIDQFLQDHPTIEIILCNGKKSYDAFCQAFPQLKAKAILCPSTSSANARMRLEDLVKIYKKVLRKTNE